MWENIHACVKVMCVQVCESIRRYSCVYMGVQVCMCVEILVCMYMSVHMCLCV